MKLESRCRERILRYLKFNAVGAAGIIVQATALLLLAKGARLNYLVATGLAVEAAVLHNFCWHLKWTWGDRSASQAAMRLLRFNLTTGLVSITGNLVLMRILAGAVGMNLIAANLMSIACCSLLNFVLSDRVVFTGRR